MARKAEYFLALQVAELSVQNAQKASQIEQLLEENARLQKAVPNDTDPKPEPPKKQVK